MWTFSQCIEATGGQGIGRPASVSAVTTDSRRPVEGALFFALSGDRFDGHDFVEAALQHGAVGAVVSQSAFAERQAAGSKRTAGSFFICVDSPVAALGRMAAWHRRRFSIPLIGITGSNGKTTTKEMLAAILSRRRATLATRGNLNNQIGLPLSLLELTDAHQVAVLEIGISRPGEMKPLCDIARPTVGIVTNVGPAHLEFLGSIEGVAREKGIMLEMAESGVVNLDDPHLAPWAARLAKKWTYSLDGPADVSVSAIRPGPNATAFRLHLAGTETDDVILSSPGRHQLQNALAAAACAWAVGCTGDDIRAGLTAFRPTAMRMEVREVGDLRVLLDAYNANPASMKAAIATLAAAPGRRVALLGDMLELGVDAAMLHAAVGQFAARAGIDCLFCVGQFAQAMADGAKQAGGQAEVYAALTDAAAPLRAVLRPGDTLLIKGSRGMKMEAILPALNPTTT